MRADRVCLVHPVPITRRRPSFVRNREQTDPLPTTRRRRRRRRGLGLGLGRRRRRKLRLRRRRRLGRRLRRTARPHSEARATVTSRSRDGYATHQHIEAIARRTRQYLPASEAHRRRPASRRITCRTSCRGRRVVRSVARRRARSQSEVERAFRVGVGRHREEMVVRLGQLGGRDEPQLAHL